MADSLDVGTLSGRIELDDNTSVTLANVSGKVDLLGAKFDDLSGRVRNVKQSHEEMGGVLDAVSQRFERIGERVAEYFAIREATRFISEIAASALALDNLSQQTDISVGDLQVLGAATREYGVDSEQLGRAIFQLSQRIAGGDQSAATALAMMGFSLKSVEGLNGKDLFLKIESGLATLQGTAKEAAAADLFGGRLGKSMIAFAGNADEALDRAQALGTYMGADAVKQLADYARNVELAESNIKNLVGQAIGPAAEGFNTLFNAAGKAGWGAVLKASLLDFVSTSTVTGASTSHLATLLDGLNQTAANSADGTKKATDAHKAAVEPLTAEAAAAKFLATVQINAQQELTPWQEKDLAYLKSIGELTPKNAAAIGVNAVQLKAYEESVKASAEEAKKYNEALKEMNDVGANWHETLVGIDGETVEAVKYYLEAGISQEKLAAAYGLSIVQVKAISQEEKAEVEGRKILISLTEAQAKAEEELVKTRIAIGQNSLKNIEADEMAALQKRYDQGKISETEYQQSLIGIKTDYARKAEDLFAQTAKNEQQVITDAAAKQIATIQQQYDQGKIDDDDFEKAKTDILLTAETKRDAIREKYDADRKDRVRQENLDIQSVADGIGNIAGRVQLLDHAWVTDGDVAAETLNKTTIMVRTLDGEIVSLAEEQKRQLQGGSVDVTSANFAQMLQQKITSGGWNPTGQGVQQYQDPYALARAGYSFAEVLQYAFNPATGTLPPPSGPRIPGFKDGGIGDFGSGTVAMLHGKEAIIPLGDTNNFLGGGVTNHFYINGTAADVARQVSNEIMRTLKAQRQFGSA